MDILSIIGMLVIALLFFGAIGALLIAMYRMIIRTGVFRKDIGQVELHTNFFKAIFFQDALK